MQYGICHLSIVPIKTSPEDVSPMVSQLLYGEHFKILETRKFWSKIRVSFDKCEGWVANNQIEQMDETAYKKMEAVKTPKYSTDLISYVSLDNSLLIPIVLGSNIPEPDVLPHSFDGACMLGKKAKGELVKTSLMYLNTPYLLGGKTPFGMDCAGFSQMVYKICGHKLKRGALEQASQGEALSFIEESEPGDLAFFDNSEGEIFHVGIILANNYIIHVNGKVRIDRLDHTGIFNTDLGSYTHNLRVIKKII